MWSKSPGCRRLPRAGAEEARTAGRLNELIKTTLGFGKEAVRGGLWRRDIANRRRRRWAQQVNAGRRYMASTPAISRQDCFMGANLARGASSSTLHSITC